MKNKKNTGFDGISNEILKRCAPIVENYLAKGINKCILEEILPDCSKTTTALPLHKRSDKNQSGKYRPISLLSKLSKVFGKVLLKRMMKFCDKHNIRSITHSGFRPKKFCIHAIATVTEYVRNGIDKKSKSQSCFIDLIKAFETFNQNILQKNQKLTASKVRLGSFQEITFNNDCYMSALLISHRTKKLSNVVYFNGQCWDVFFSAYA